MDNQSSQPTDDRYFLAGGTKPLPSLSLAGARFAAHHSHLLDFILFVFESSAFWSLASSKKATHSEQNELPSKITGEVARGHFDFMQGLASHNALIGEFIVSRIVDEFLSYISDLLALIFKVRPEMLKSSEQERIDVILQYADMDELRAGIAEKKVERLSYLGLRELAEYIESHMGFDLFTTGPELEQAALIVEFRNVIVHNRGVVGAASVRRFPSLKPQLGSRLTLTHKQIREHKEFLEQAVLDIDVRATEKFKLPATHY